MQWNIIDVNKTITWLFKLWFYDVTNIIFHGQLHNNFLDIHSRGKHLCSDPPSFFICSTNAFHQKHLQSLEKSILIILQFSDLFYFHQLAPLGITPTIILLFDKCMILKILHEINLQTILCQHALEPVKLNWIGNTRLFLRILFIFCKLNQNYKT